MTNESKIDYWNTLSNKGYASLYNAKAEQYSGKDLEELDDNLFRNEEGKYIAGIYNMSPKQIDLISKVKTEQHLKVIKIVLCTGFAISIIGGLVLGIVAIF